MRSDDGTKLWCSDLYADVGLVAVGDEDVYLVGYHAGEQQRAIYVLRQRDGSQRARYTPDDPARLGMLESIVFAQV